MLKVQGHTMNQFQTLLKVSVLLLFVNTIMGTLHFSSTISVKIMPPTWYPFSCTTKYVLNTPTLDLLLYSGFTKCHKLISWVAEIPVGFSLLREKLLEKKFKDTNFSWKSTMNVSFVCYTYLTGSERQRGSRATHLKKQRCRPKCGNCAGWRAPVASEGFIFVFSQPRFNSDSY